MPVSWTWTPPLFPFGWSLSALLHPSTCYCQLLNPLSASPSLTISLHIFNTLFMVSFCYFISYTVADPKRRLVKSIAVADKLAGSQTCLHSQPLSFNLIVIEYGVWICWLDFLTANLASNGLFGSTCPTCHVCVPLAILES